MYKTIVQTVKGNKVYAAGKWLICIGNKPVHTGDHVWTDGRCIYGNVLESGAPFILKKEGEDGIPLFSIYRGFSKKGNRFTLYYPYFENYSKNKIYTIKDVKRDQLITLYAGLVNNKNKFELIDDKSYGDNFCGILDVEMNNKGEIYVLEAVKNKSYVYHDAKMIGGNIFKNGQIVDSYLKKLEDAMSELKSEAAIRGISYSTAETLGGFIDKNGEYQVYCWIEAYCRYMYPDTDVPPYNEGYSQTIRTSHQRCVIISNSKTITIIDSGLHYNLSGIETDFFTIKMDDHSLKLPVQDGYYFTFAFPPSMRNITGSGFEGTYIDYDTSYSCYTILFPMSLEGFEPDKNDPYEVKIYDKKDSLIATLDYHFAMPLNIKICSIKKNKCLFFPYAENQQYYGDYGGLFIIDAKGKISELKSQYMAETEYIKNNAAEYHMKPLNFRLRPLKDIKKWKKSISKYVKKEI